MRFPRPSRPDGLGPERRAARRARRSVARDAKAAASETEKTAESKAPIEPLGRRGELWFRLTTRLTAARYWLREKAQPAGRAIAGAARALAGLWTARSVTTRRRTVAAAGLLALLAVIRLAPVPGVPCQVSAANECAPEDRVVAQVPENALLYFHLTLQRDSDQYERASGFGGRFPDAAALLNNFISGIATPSGAPVMSLGEVLAWTKDDLSFALLPPETPREGPQALFVAGISDKDGADAFLKQVAPEGEPRPAEQHGSALTLYGDGVAAAYSGDGELIFGDEAAVRASLDTGAGRAPGLGDGAGDVRAGLPDLRFADLYLSRRGIGELLAGAGTGASQLETFVDYNASQALAISAGARADGVELDLFSALDEKTARAEPSFFTQLAEFEPGLASRAGSDALGYLGLGEIGPTLAKLLGESPAPSAGAERGDGAHKGAGKGKSEQKSQLPVEEPTGLVAALRGLSERVRAESDVDLIGELLPALGGEAALIAEPTDGLPFATLVVDGVESDAASKALIALQGPILRAVTDPSSGRVPKFTEQEIEGISASTVDISPALQLTYALSGDELVISTNPDGVAGARRDDAGLAGTSAYRSVIEHLPDRVSALVFLNVEKLLGEAVRGGIAEDPFYASLSADLAELSSLGLAVEADEDELHSTLFLAIGN